MSTLCVVPSCPPTELASQVHIAKQRRKAAIDSLLLTTYYFEVRSIYHIISYDHIYSGLYFFNLQKHHICTAFSIYMLVGEHFVYSTSLYAIILRSTILDANLRVG